MQLNHAEIIYLWKNAFMYLENGEEVIVETLITRARSLKYHCHMDCYEENSSTPGRPRTVLVVEISSGIQQKALGAPSRQTL